MKVTRRTALADLPEFLSPTELASLLGIGRAAAYEALRRGDIPSIRLNDRMLRIPRAALLALAEPRCA